MKTKKVLAVVAAASMVATMAGCSKKEDTTPTTTVNNTAETTKNGDNTAETTKSGGNSSSGPLKEIVLGSWWEHYYTSDHNSPDDNPGEDKPDIAEIKLQNMRDIEAKYGVKFRCENLTWDGTINSINTSIMAGTPECQIYNVDLQFGVPAVLGGLALALEDFVPADNDIFNDHNVLQGLKMADDAPTYLFQPFSAADQYNGYPLGYNKSMIAEANLEDPQELWKKGEWTWDKFFEYIEKLTKDTDGDGKTNVYGMGGVHTVLLSQMLMSNGTDIAATGTQHLDSPATQEVIEFIEKMYTKGYARPWDTADFWINNDVGKTQEVCFFDAAAWILQGWGANSEDFAFEFGIVPWPVGPSATLDQTKEPDKNQYKGLAVAGNWYIIPASYKNDLDNAKLIYNVYYDWANWHKGDAELRDDLDWQKNQFVTDENFEMAGESGKYKVFDNWQNLKDAEGNGFSLYSMLVPDAETGEVKTAAQLIQENAPLVQAMLDDAFGK